MSADDAKQSLGFGLCGVEAGDEIAGINGSLAGFLLNTGLGHGHDLASPGEVQSIRFDRDNLYGPRVDSAMAWFGQFKRGDWPWVSVLACWSIFFWLPLIPRT
jgi:hypothetical protein